MTAGGGAQNRLSHFYMEGGTHGRGEEVWETRLMERDMDLLREILLALEKAKFQPAHLYIPLAVPGYTEEQVQYHLLLLSDAGLIEGIRLNSFLPRRLTWDGHEFLDAARDKSRWTRAKKMVLEKAGVLSFEALRQVLLALVKQSLSS